LLPSTESVLPSTESREGGELKGAAGSIGCAIAWCVDELSCFLIIESLYSSAYNFI